MIDAFEIGISLALQDGISDSITQARRNVAALEKAVIATGISLQSLRDAGIRAASVRAPDSRQPASRPTVLRVIGDPSTVAAKDSAAPAAVQWRDWSGTQNDLPATSEQSASRATIHREREAEQDHIGEVRTGGFSLDKQNGSLSEPIESQGTPRASRFEREGLEADRALAPVDVQPVSPLRQISLQDGGQAENKPNSGSNAPSALASQVGASSCLLGEAFVPQAFSIASEAQTTPFGRAASDDTVAQDPLAPRGALARSWGQDPALPLQDDRYMGRERGSLPSPTMDIQTMLRASLPQAEDAQQSAAPQAAPREQGAFNGDVYLDGMLVGRWISRFLQKEGERADIGPTGFDAKRGRLLPGATVG